MKRFQTTACRVSALGLACLLLAEPAAAATLRVTHYQDDFDDGNGTCSLREALRAANQDAAIDACNAGSGAVQDLILLPAGTHVIDLTGGSGENAALVGDLDIVGSVEIRGVSSQLTLIDGSGGTPIDRLIEIRESADEVDIRRVALVGGVAESPDGRGGVMLNSEFSPGLVLLEEVEIRGGRAFRGGGIYNDGKLEIRDSVVSGNQTVDDGTTTNSGGGIASDAGGVSIRIADSEVSGNTADDDGGGVESAGAFAGLYRSRIVGNTAAGDGGGLYLDTDEVDIQYVEVRGNTAARGGGIFRLSPMGELRHSAVVQNTATSSGGGLHLAGMSITRFSTIAANTSPLGAGVHSDAAMTLFDSVAIARNQGVGLYNQAGALFELSILAENTAGNCGGNAIAAGGLNIEDGSSCALPPDVGGLPNLSSTNPMLGSLDLHGGRTPVLALLPGSPAIDAATSDLRPNCQNDLDQRGRARGRPRTPGAMGGPDIFACDIGPYEQTTPFVVDSLADAVDADPNDDLCLTAGLVCSLRAAVMQANQTPGKTEIELGPGTHTLSLPETGGAPAQDGDLDVAAVVELRGAGVGTTIVDGAGVDRVFEFELPDAEGEPAELVSLLQDLTITGGAVSAPENGGGVLARGPLRLERVELYGNSAQRGAAISTVASGFAMNPAADHRVELVESTVRDHATALAVFGVNYLIERSSVVDNSASGGEFLRVHLLNSTFSGNSGGNAGAFFASEAIVDSSTIFGNSNAFSPAGVFLLEQSVFRSSILADNLAGGLPADCETNPNAAVSLGFNLSDGDGVDCGLFDASDQLSTDPLLGLLADNGGPTRTHLPSVDSPAIDTGADASCPSKDQRGIPRPQDGDDAGGARCDVGAVEFVPEPGAVTGLIAGAMLLWSLKRRRRSVATASGGSV